VQGESNGIQKIKNSENRLLKISQEKLTILWKSVNQHLKKYEKSTQNCTLKNTAQIVNIQTLNNSQGDEVTASVLEPAVDELDLYR